MKKKWVKWRKRSLIKAKKSWNCKTKSKHWWVRYALVLQIHALMYTAEKKVATMPCHHFCNIALNLSMKKAWVAFLLLSNLSNTTVNIVNLLYCRSSLFLQQLFYGQKPFHNKNMNGKCFLSRGIFAREKLEQIRKILRKQRNEAILSQKYIFQKCF